MNFFEVLVHPDREELEAGERALVCSAANLLQVGEFQLLQLAYQEWFGRDLPQALVARLFGDYMLRNEVPHWARHYARLILAREEHGLLDIDDPAYHRYDHDYHTVVPQGLRRFCIAVGILTFVLVSSLLVASLSATKSLSLLPPYFEEREMPTKEPVANWGRADGHVQPPAGD
ncbi:MAG: hypothetical protein ACFCUO_06185 [Rhodospirillales bacterium]